MQDWTFNERRARLTGTAVVAVAAVAIGLLPIVADAQVGATLAGRSHTLNLIRGPMPPWAASGPDEFAPQQCENPTFPSICVEAGKGNYSEISLEICGSSCPEHGVWAWTSKIVDGSGNPTKMRVTFKPRTGNPTTESIDWRGTKKGVYTQTITGCNSPTSCASVTGSVYVIDDPPPATSNNFVPEAAIAKPELAFGDGRENLRAVPSLMSRNGMARHGVGYVHAGADGRFHPGIPAACNRPFWLMWPLICVRSVAGSSGSNLYGVINVFGQLVGNNWAWAARGVFVGGTLTGAFNPPVGNPTVFTITYPNGGAAPGLYTYSMYACVTSGCVSRLFPVLIY